MNFEKICYNERYICFLVKGRLDSDTSPDLEKIVLECIDGLEKLEFDFSDLDYISSRGLRLLLMAQKKMLSQGEMAVLNPNPTIMDVFEITGFDDILNIK